MSWRFRACFILICVLIAIRGVVAAEPAASRIPDKIPDKPLPIQAVQQIAELSDGRIAFGSEHGLALWHDGKLQSFSGSTFAVSRLLAAKDGSLWVGSSQGLARFKDDDFGDVTPRISEVVRQKDEAGNPHERPLDLDVMSLFEASDGRILIGLRYAALVVYTPDSDKYELISLAPELDLEAPPDANNWVRCVAEDHEKRLWACISRLGLFQIDDGQIRDIPKKHKRWTTIDDPRALLFDSQNNLWIGTTSGVERYGADGSRSVLTVEGGLPGSLVEEIHEDSPGKIWITASFKGACIHDGKALRYPVFEPDEDGAFATLFKSRSGNYWRSDWHQVSCLSNVEWVSKSPLERAIDRVQAQVALEYPDVVGNSSTVVDGRGRVWVRVMDRLLRFDGKEWTRVPALKTTRPNLGMMKVDSRGRVLICSDQGLLIYDGDKGTLVGDGPQPDGSPGPAAYVYDVAEGPDRVIYAGTQGGLYSLSGNELELLTTGQRYQALTVAVDSTGAVWFNDANTGLHRYENGQTERFVDFPVQGQDIMALEPLPEKGVTVYSQTASLKDVVLKAIDFDGDFVTSVRKPNPLLGLDARDRAGSCVVAKVFFRSAAAKAGIAVGDVLSEIDGRRIGGFAELTEAIGKLKAGDAVRFALRRKDQPRTVEVILKKWP